MEGQNVRADSDAWLAMMDTLREIEMRKRQFGPGSPGFLALARQVDDLSRLVFEIGHRQLENARAAQDRADMQTPTEHVDPPRSVPAIIDAWREAERRLARAEAGSLEATEAQAEVEMLRAEYREAARALHLG